MFPDFADIPMLRDLGSRGMICVCFLEADDGVIPKTFHHGLSHWTVFWRAVVASQCGEILGGGSGMVMLHEGDLRHPTIKAFLSVTKERCTAYNIIWRA